jgi:hypothetical protein
VGFLHLGRERWSRRLWCKGAECPTPMTRNDQKIFFMANPASNRELETERMVEEGSGQAKIVWYDPGAGGPPSDHPMWLALPLFFQSPEQVSGYAREMERTGKWTHAQVVNFMQTAAPAYTVNAWFGRDPDTGQLPNNEVERATNMIERLGLLPIDPTTGTRMTKAQFIAVFQHATNVWYPLGFLPGFIEIYCTTDVTGRVTGWNEDVLRFLQDPSIPIAQKTNLHRLSAIDGPDLRLDPSMSREKRLEYFRLFCHNFGLNFFVEVDGPRVNLQVSDLGTHVVPGGALSTLMGDQNSVLRLQEFCNTQNMYNLQHGLPQITPETLRRMLYLSNGPFSIEEQYGILRYHQDHTSRLGTEAYMRAMVQGGIGEYIHLSWLDQQIRAGSAAVWGFLGTNYNPIGDIHLEAGRTYSRAATGRHMIAPDMVLWDISIDPSTTLEIDHSAATEEVDTSSELGGRNNPIEHVFRGLLGVTRVCNPDLSGLGPNPTASQIDVRRNSVYKCTNLRVVSGSTLQGDLHQLLTQGGTVNYENMRMIGLPGGGVRGALRLDDGDAIMPAAHMIFEIVPDPAATMPDSYLVRTRIGTFANLQGDGAPDVLSAQFVPGSVWYDSWNNPTFLRLGILQYSQGNLVTSAGIQAQATVLGQHLYTTVMNRGFIVNRADWQYMRMYDVPTYTALLRRIVPGIFEDELSRLVGGGQGYSPVKMGTFTIGFRFSVVLDTESNTGEGVIIGQTGYGFTGINIWRDNTGVISSGYTQHILTCPALGNTARPSETPVLARDVAQVAARQSRIDEDFDLAGVLAEYFREIAFGDPFWRHMFRQSNGWDPATDVVRATRWLKNRLSELRSAIPNSHAFTIDSPAVHQFLSDLKALAIGFDFPNSRTRANRALAQRSILDSFANMWEKLLNEYGQTKDGDKAVEIRTFVRAIIFNWPIGVGRERSLAILEQHYTRLPTFTQLRLHSLDWGFGVIDTRPIADGAGNRIFNGWCYARILYASPDGPVREFLVRYRPDANLANSWGSGFEAYALFDRSRSEWIASCDPEIVYNIISGVIPLPPGFSSIGQFLGLLARVQIGGHQVPPLSGQNPTTLLDLGHLVP